MTILNSTLTIKKITNWVQNYTKENYRKSFVICDYNTPGSKLVETICKNISNVPIFIAENIQDAIDISETQRGLIIGTLNRNEAELIRRYHKYREGIGDIFPIADLFYSEILELLKGDFDKDPKIDDILLHSEVEWGDRENCKSGIIINEKEPKTCRGWFRYTLRQKEILSRMHQIEKRTRHKKISAPTFRIRSVEGLIR